MNKRINYVVDTLEDIALHFSVCSRQTVNLATKCYTDNHVVFKKLAKADVLAKIIKLQHKFETMD